MNSWINWTYCHSSFSKSFLNSQLQSAHLLCFPWKPVISCLWIPGNICSHGSFHYCSNCSAVDRSSTNSYKQYQPEYSELLLCLCCHNYLWWTWWSSHSGFPNGLYILVFGYCLKLLADFAIVLKTSKILDCLYRISCRWWMPVDQLFLHLLLFSRYTTVSETTVIGYSRFWILSWLF